MLSIVHLVRVQTQRWLLSAAIAFAYLYSFPYFAPIRSANELPRVYLTMAMVEEGTFAIDTGVARFGSTVDVSPSKGHFYSNKAPGSSMLAIPGYMVLKGVTAIGGRSPSLAESVWVARITTGVIPTLLFLLLLWRFLGRFGGSESSRRTAIVAYALGSMAMTYSLLFIAHQLSAVCIGTALIIITWVIEDGLDRRWLLAAGAAAGAAVLCDYQAAFAGIPLAVWLTHNTLSGKSRDVRALALAALGAAIPIAILLIYHWQAFGHPLRTGYHASETFAHFHQRGFLGLDKFRPEAFFGSTFAPDNGLFFLSPFLLLSFVGWRLLLKRGQNMALAIVCASTIVIYIAFISSIAFWRGGWQMGPRYITVMLPAAMVLVTYALVVTEKQWWTRGLALATVLVAVVIYSLSCAQFPHFPEKFKNPFFELTLPLYRDGYAPYSLGWALGLRGLAAHIPYFVAIGAALWLSIQPSKTKWRAPLLAVAVAAVVLVVYSMFDGGGSTAARAYETVKSVYPK